jgi:hypothetical protein
MMVDEALAELARIDPRQAQIVELKYLRRFIGTGSRRHPIDLASDSHTGMASRPGVALSSSDKRTQTGSLVNTEAP